MPELSLDEDPCPSGEIINYEKDYFLSACSMLDRQCDHLDEDGTAGLWRGVDVGGMSVEELPLLLGSSHELYNGPFLRFCNKAVNKKGYRRLGTDNELLNLRLKIVGPAVSEPSITIMLQKEYAGYDVSLEGDQIIRSRLGSCPEVLTGDKAIEIIDDIQFVAAQLIRVAYHSAPVSSKIQECDSRVQSATSKELAIRPRRSFGRLALRRFKT
jgi:hypothetical protein